MKGIFARLLVAALLLAAPSAYAASPAPIGSVRVIDGDVTIVRAGKTFRATPDMYLYEGDAVETGAHGKAGLTMEDDTTISLGRRSQVVLTKFQYPPQKKHLSFLVKLVQGTASFVLGKISKLAPDSVRIETPQAAIGVRGSHVLVKVD